MQVRSLRRRPRGTVAWCVLLAAGATAVLALDLLQPGRPGPAGADRVTASPGTGEVSLMAAVEGEVDAATSTATNLSANNPFGISVGSLGPLAPGVSLPLDLALTNPNNAAIQVTELTVALGGVDPAHAVGCPAATNYAVVQYSGSYALLVVPEGATRTLTQLGVPSVKLPRVNMKDTSVNQNACMGAVLTLTYSGSATGGAR